MPPSYPHLPPGREPGRQSRGQRLAGRIFAYVFPAIGVFFLLLFVPIALALGQPVFLLAGIGGAAAFIGGGLVFYRRLHPRIAKHFELSVDAIDVRRGATVTARVQITDLARASDLIEVGLECEVRHDVWERTHSSDGGSDRSRTTRFERAYEQWVRLGKAQPVHEVTLEIPRDGPYSHEGSCLSFAWRVTAREPTPRRSDPVRHQPIWVLP